MTKTVAIYPIVAAAFVALVLLNSSPHKPTNKQAGHRHVRLSRRLGDGPAPLFDPLVMKIEQKAVLRKEPENRSEDVEIVEAELEEEDEEFFGNDGKLNLTLRLNILYPFIDRAPRDGYIDQKELEDWNTLLAHERMDYKTRDKLEENDRNDDGFLSFSEFLPHFSQKDIIANDMSHGEAGWWLEQYKNADADQDGLLKFEELRDLLCPEDSKNVKVENWLLQEKTRRMDKNNNGKVHFQEFEENAYGNFKSYYLFNGETDVPSVQELFSTLDSDKNKYIYYENTRYQRFLTFDELKPVKQFLFPEELDYANFVTNHLMKEVDDDRDGKLTLAEVLRHEDRFYHSIYIDEEEQGYDDDDDYDYEYVHDEF